MSIYSNDNIRKIAKLTTRELPQKSKNAKITVRKNNGLYSNNWTRIAELHVEWQNLTFLKNNIKNPFLPFFIFYFLLGGMLLWGNFWVHEY